MTAAQLSILFFLQLAVIVVTCRVVGWLAHKYLKQPQVVGEMIAGVLLGPSLFGALAPMAQGALFPADSKNILFVCAQLGVGLYMFLVGLGFDRKEFRANAASAASVSLTGMFAPFIVAALITPWLMGAPGLFSDKVGRFEATLFMGAAIAITAFPMLARIIHERGLSNTPLGTLSLSAGAIDDAGAWIVLAIVLASLGDGPAAAYLAIGGGVSFALFSIFAAPRLLAPLGRMVERDGEVSNTVLALTLIAFLLSAFAMDAVGLHAVFGGFLIGTAMPRGAFVAAIKEKLEPIAVVLFLPIFFTYSGLHTELLMVNSLSLVGIGLVTLFASILAKGGACYLAARLTGQNHPTALGIGALMNARGLMELIIINIGLQRGVIGPALFSMLVMMAIITTLMASPLFELVRERYFANPEGKDEPELQATERQASHCRSVIE